MLRESEIHQMLTDKIRSEVPTAAPAIIFEALCHAFPLRRLHSKKAHASALSVSIKIAEFLTTQDVPSSIKKQILEYADSLGLLIETFEREGTQKKVPAVFGKDILAYLMAEHNLRQTDLRKELGGQSIVSAVLAGKRNINRKQMLALGKRFGVNPGLFVE